VLLRLVIKFTLDMSRRKIAVFVKRSPGSVIVWSPRSASARKHKSNIYFEARLWISCMYVQDKKQAIVRHASIVS